MRCFTHSKSVAVPFTLNCYRITTVVLMTQCNGDNNGNVSFENFKLLRVEATHTCVCKNFLVKFSHRLYVNFKNTKETRHVGMIGFTSWSSKSNKRKMLITIASYFFLPCTKLQRSRMDVLRNLLRRITIAGLEQGDTYTALPDMSNDLTQ